jgi:PAS domain-containing protein
MILRVHRARAAAGARGEMLAHLRDRVYPATVGKPGLRTLQAGIRDLPDGMLELAVVSTWQDFDALRRGVGDGLAGAPLAAADTRGGLVQEDADHFELVGEELSGVIPLGGGALRILTGTILPGRGDTFFDFARGVQATQLDSGELLVTHIGRRLTGTSEEAVYVAVWRDADASALRGGTDDAPAYRELWQPYFESWSFAAYDALARVSPQGGAATVLLLADDDRRYLFASPAAERLFGQTPARLLGRRLEDVLALTEPGDMRPLWDEFVRDGAQSGMFQLTRPDGTSAMVHYEARANTPWPGVHASVLGESDASIDFDETLAAAGIVARYVVA